MAITTALALRTLLRVDALDATCLAAAASSAADGVLLDLASAAAYSKRADARRAANHAAEAIAQAGRPVHARVSDLRSGATEGDIQSIVRANLAAVMLAGCEVAQDARSIDVSIRKQEMGRGMEPGGVRLIVEIDSAAGLRALPAMLDAIDRTSAVALDVCALAADLRLPGAPAQQLAALEHAMAEVALVTAAGGITWVLSAPGLDAGARAALATRAHAHGAAGVVVAAEAEAAGLTRLFTLDPTAIDAARGVVAQWERLHAAGEESGVSGALVVDRRTMRRARALIEQADAVARRERVRG